MEHCYDCASDLSKTQEKVLIEHFWPQFWLTTTQARRTAEYWGANDGLQINKTARATMPPAFGRTCDGVSVKWKRPDAYIETWDDVNGDII